VTKTRIMA